MERQKLPALIRLYIKSCIIGFAVAAVFVGLMLWFDVVGLRGLVAHAEGGVLAVVVLWVLNGIVFAGVQFGYAIMSMAGTAPEDDDDAGGPDHAVRDGLPVPVRADDTR